MAAIRAAEELEANTPGGLRRKFVLVSFENDLDSLHLALRHPLWFKHIRHSGPQAVLKQQRWESASGMIEWLLLPGDFAQRKFEAPAPDVIFFDPFSFKTDSELWTLASFRELAAICNDMRTELFTYTYSTQVRAAMLAAGFYVAKGRATGPKAETTVGLSARAAADTRHELLGAEWLERWQRSHMQVPLGAEGDESWRSAVEQHPQFQR
jgi:queuine tRNA-ribosyltransferase